MPWPCFMDLEEESWEPGAMWFEPERPDGHILGRPVSPEYYRDHAGKRPLLMVMLPHRLGDGHVAGWPFCPDANATGSDHGWTVTGEPPRITVAPSINAVGVYHGLVTDGVVSDGLP